MRSMMCMKLTSQTKPKPPNERLFLFKNYDKKLGGYELWRFLMKQ